MRIPPIKVAILNSNRQDLFPANCEAPVELVWMDKLESFLEFPADLFIDLDFDGSEQRKENLAKLKKPIAVNAVNWPCSKLPPGFVRINAWPGFTHPELVELAFTQDMLPKELDYFLKACGKTWMKVPDVAGMIRPRILAMILNEAWMTLEEGISTREEIDIAMKLGTNYPMGPFEWTSLIGEKNVLQLLIILAGENPAYKPSRLLEQSLLPT
ncbi:3-hydroxyacyl-CoA dehydrogenase family protein [Flavihumibacter sp. RY-1]|uniref:3-hydroxyacyl-CoA dehydrogenase family protein n=1 Tax=Flavihumibacter fluminis TaxID=2909236 RepID=A0ABS9BMT1_9BACT|nr:3-hydroxyacyl-CoA dehydrogenase family protein [Flavihumibacter fluminis]MCF1716960.1 3-hydroxyacyl-CoA dehydrogenase family protein [Flavihumibacter fluminis]